MVIILIPLLPKYQLLVTSRPEIPKKENGVVLFALHAIAFYSEYLQIPSRKPFDERILISLFT